MKTLLGLLACLMVLGSSARERRDLAQIGRYEQANNELIMQPNDGKRVVLLGNSITEDWAEVHPEFFGEHRLTGRGIGGQTSHEMLLRFRRDVMALAPSVVVISAGTNDIAENTGPYREDVTMGNIETMIMLARHAGIRVVIASVLPCDHYVWNPDVDDVPGKVARLNQRLQALSTQYDAPYVDYFTPLVAQDGHALNPAYTEDGVHPTLPGFLLMEQALLPVIEKLR